MILAATAHRSRTCQWCGTTYVVASLARACEDKHVEEDE